MSSIRQPTAADTLKLLALGAIWGSSFLFTSLALTDLPPVTITALRISLAAVLLMGVAWLRGQSLPRVRGEWAAVAGTGLFGSALPFFLISWGQQEVPAGLAAILMGGGPFAALLLSHLFTHDDRFSLPKVIGLIVGFSGVVVLVGRDALAGDGAIWSHLAIVAAAFCYATGGVITRRIAHLPTEMAAGAILLTAAAYMAPLALALDRPWRFEVSTTSLAAVAFLGVMSTGFAALLRFQIIRDAGATFMAQVNYLVPLFGVFWAWIFLAERPSLTAWVALVLILAGINITRVRRTGRGPTS